MSNVSEPIAWQDILTVELEGFLSPENYTYTLLTGNGTKANNVTLELEVLQGFSFKNLTVS
jgi:hypothetical protein